MMRRDFKQHNSVKGLTSLVQINNVDNLQNNNLQNLMPQHLIHQSNWTKG